LNLGPRAEEGLFRGKALATIKNNNATKVKDMKRAFNSMIICGALLAASQFAAFAADEKTESKEAGGIRREKAILLSITASVEEINATNREVTLKGPLGNTVTFTVDERVKRFNEIKVGDYVTADYYISLAADLRAPTPEEETHPIMILEAKGKAPPGTSPAAGGLRRIKVVTTVEGLDRPTETITVKGPRGNYLTAKVEDPANLTKMKIGDHIVVTYTEALAISLQKAEKKSED
jgi:hypothetical protein